MKGKDSICFLIIIGLSFPVGYFIVPNCYKQYSEIITFLSILIGFQITAISILFNSRILNTLYDNKNKVYGTELHKLKVYFKYSINFELTAIVLMLLLPNFINFCIINKEIYLSKSLLVLPTITGSVYCFLKTSNELFRIFILPRNE